VLTAHRLPITCFWTPTIVIAVPAFPAGSPGAQIDRPAGEETFVPPAGRSSQPLTADSTRRNAFSLTPPSTRTRNPSRQIDLDYPTRKMKRSSGNASGSRSRRQPAVSSKLLDQQVCA
jgi:hypothetical protein